MPHVKVVYESEGEIRRYLLPSGAGAFEELRNKIRAVVGPNVNFRIFWKDAEGDTVACDSDVELQAATDSVATTETPSEVVKLYVRITGTSTPTPSVATASVHEEDAEMKEGEGKEEKPEPAKEGAEASNIHRGIYCDGCQGPVAGIRYKCMKCDNYDLCEACKGKNFHAEHEMEAILFREDTGPKVHVGVECDGCGGEVAGTRYKCTQCFSYDLCETCKGKGFHAEHEMTAVQDPEFPQNFGFAFPFPPWNRPAAGGCQRGRRGHGGCGRFPGMRGFGRPMWQGMGGNGGFMGQGQGGRWGRDQPLTPEAMDEVARQLQAMGIQADGGILRELIEQFHGDIARIIEAMN